LLLCLNIKPISYNCVGLNETVLRSINNVDNLSGSINKNQFYYENKYAVIIVGRSDDEQHYEWFTNDAQRQYSVLNEKYGFNQDNIFVLLTLREEWSDVLRIDSSLIDYDATEENISGIFMQLKEVITENDLLYIVVISHGGDTHHLYFQNLNFDIDFWQGIFSHDTFFALEGLSNLIIDSDSVYIRGNRSSVIDTRVYDYEFGEYTNDIDARRIIYVLQPCFSGGFINDLSKDNHVVISASTEPQPAFAPFIGYFFKGLNGSAQDYNLDGRISLGEIYEYTAGEVYQWIEDNPDGNMGRNQYPLIDDNGKKIGNRIKKNPNPNNAVNGNKISPTLFTGSKIQSLFIFLIIVFSVFIAYQILKDPTYNPNIQFCDGYIASRIYDLNYEEL